MNHLLITLTILTILTSDHPDHPDNLNHPDHPNYWSVTRVSLGGKIGLFCVLYNFAVVLKS